MARGYIYKVDTTEDETENTLSEEWFYASLSGNECDYVNDCKDPQPVEYFVEMLQAFGYNIIKKTGIENVYAVIQPMNEENLAECKKSYFRNRYDELKRKLREISLDEFSSKTGTANALAGLIEDKYGNMIYTNGTHYILDDFIRDMVPSTMYYIQKKTVLMG